MDLKSNLVFFPLLEFYKQMELQYINRQSRKVLAEMTVRGLELHPNLLSTLGF